MESQVNIHEWRSLPASPGVYCLTCTVTGESYVGRAGNVQARVHNHACSLEGGYHICKAMQAVYDRFGRGAFAVAVLESGQDFTSLRPREAHWIQHLDATFNKRLRHSGTRTARPTGLVSMAVTSDTYEHLKVIGKARGISARGMLCFLAELVEVTTPEQQGAAYSRFLERRRRPRQPA